MFQEEREKFPRKYPKRTLPNKTGYYFATKTGKVWKGFGLYEVENEQQIINHTLFWSSLYQFKWVPIIRQIDTLEPLIDFDLIK